jgi:formyltetrahydrofolate hydrolase
VKIIGAKAHCVIEELDAGPIIQQRTMVHENRTVVS